MARARRAKTRPSRVLVPLLGAALAAAGVAGWQLRPDSTPTDVDEPAASSPAAPVATPTPSPTPTPSSGSSAAAALDDCRARVRAGDDVVAAARTGVGHWADHVQAQTEAEAEEISVAEMDGVFARTRLAGPADQERWTAARRAHDATTDGSCAAVPGASPSQAAALERCRERDRAQQTVIEAAVPAIRDWDSHLAAMRHSRSEDVPDAEQVWLDAWRAAPPHIEAFQKADQGFDAPRC